MKIELEGSDIERIAEKDKKMKAEQIKVPHDNRSSHRALKRSTAQGA